MKEGRLSSDLQERYGITENNAVGKVLWHSLNENGKFAREGTLESGRYQPDYYFIKDISTNIYTMTGEGKYWKKSPSRNDISAALNQLQNYVMISKREFGDHFTKCFFTTNYADVFENDFDLLKENLKLIGVAVVMFDLDFLGFKPAH